MKFALYVLAAGLLILSCAAIFNPNPFLFDERLFPPNILLMEKYGFSERFLIEMVDQAPGPLYEFVHLPLKGITNLTPTGLRTVNLILFFGVIALLACYYRLEKQPLKTSLYSSLHLVAIPTLWQVAGLALTEIPAMLFAMLSFFIGAYLLNKRNELSNVKALLFFILMGITGGLAVMGRTPYLVIIPAFFLVVLIQKYWLKQNQLPLWGLLIYGAIPLAMVIPIFVIWGGLVPPLQPKVSGAIQPWHGLLAMAYASIVTLVLRPQWFLFSRRIAIMLVIGFFVFLLLNIFTTPMGYAPMSTTVGKIIGDDKILLYAQIISPLLATVGLYFFICSLYRAWENKEDQTYLFATFVTLAILASSAKISHQFSSRYVAQAAPFMVIMFVRANEEDKWKFARLAIGIVIGLLSLNTYAELF